RRAAGAARDLPPADATTAAARGAVDEPSAEANARAAADLAAALGGAPPPSPEIVALCERIRTAIREHRPADEDELTRADIQGAAREAGTSVNSSVQGDADRVAGSYDGLQQTPSGTTATGTPVTTPPPAVADPGINATTAAPDPIPQENLSLDADRDRVETMADSSRIERHSTEPLADTPPYNEVRAGRDELTGLAETAPVDLAAQQQTAIVQAQADMATLQRQALASLNESRGGTVRGVADRQGGMVGHETQTRESVSAQAQAIFTEAQTQVQQLLEPLSRTAMGRWDAEVERLSREFRSRLDEVQRWIDERHSGAGGFVVGLWDAVAGLPGWVTREYDDAERRFGDGVCDVLMSISADVASVISAAQALIQRARDRTHELFARLPADLQEWAAGEEQRFTAQLDGLSQRTEAARTSFVQEISTKAVTAVGEVQRQVEELRQRAGGLVGRIVAAIQAFIDDPVRAIINGLLTLVGIPAASFWALIDRIGQVVDQIADDPETFANNLVAALRLGFQGFFDRFGEHLAASFWRWLFSRCRRVGVTIPRDASIGSIITFILSVMGITWPRIRAILVRQVGPRAVEVVEKVWQLVSLLIQRGPDGVWEMLRERLTPEAIVEAVVQAAVDFAVQALIERVALRLLAMLNPAGAVLQAIELIWTVLKWVFENAAQIFTLVETIVNACAEIMAGNLAGVAQMVENGLAMLLPLVIDLLAGMIGLGDLPDQVADTIAELQAMVQPVLERVITELVTRGRALLAAIGVGGGAAGDGDEEVGETVRFSGGGESHRLWVDAAASHLMVASTPTPLQSRVAQWRTEVTQMPPEEEKKARAAALLDQIEPLVADGNSQVAPAKQEVQQNHQAATAAAGGGAGGGGGAGTPPSETHVADDLLEATEQQIAGLLNQLIELLVPNIDDIIGEFRDDLLGQVPAKVDQLTSAWSSPLENLMVGPVNQRQKLIPGPAATTFAGLTGAGGESVLTEQSNLRALAAYFVVHPRAPKVGNQTFYDYVFLNRHPQPPHRVRTAFIAGVGNDAVSSIRRAVGERLSGSELVLSDEEKTAIRDQLAGVSFQIGPTSDHGSFRGLGTREPDHAYFIPTSITARAEDTLAYRTASGQEFSIELEGKLPKRVVGRQLSQFSGRGITQDSAYFLPGMNYNRAHVIANRFGGTGFADYGNLVTTSRYYNHPKMSGAENDIVRRLNAATGNGERRVPGTPPPGVGGVTFSLAVDLEYMAVTEPIVAAAVVGDPDLPDKADEIRAKILDRLREAGVIDKLKRVDETTYSLGDVEPTLTPADLTPLSIGPDRWLLTGQ
ncbi:DNA/RNA non-specific endonuclease, partial [Nocardioides sp.]|uniref:DNA/RNA non-specific endonuclease n=1 Tax=Nocardioides sp. TaxID=35761 RepID=UPI002618155C